MKPTILLTGKKGQIGAELCRLLPSLGKVVALDRQQLDLTKPEGLRRAIGEVRPNWIVNAAAYTAVDQAEKEESIARAVNSDAPALMAVEAQRIGASLMHYSTDYVFDGLKNSPYEENDSTNPVNAYGRTKLAGEQAIRDSGVPHLIFRTAWVYGTTGRNFLLTVLRLAAQKEELRIVRDQVGAPSWSREIARATSKVMAQIVDQRSEALAMSKVGGTYHMTAAGETNWYDFARAILEEASNKDGSVPWFAAATGGRPLIAQRVVPIATWEYPTPARRPAYSVLSFARLQQTFGLQLPDWRTQLHSAFQSNET
jgi:dTDP-4-dehydrorhamnose reductase